MTLKPLIESFETWAATADRSEAGWQTDFPGWPSLAAACKQAMTTPHPSEDLVDDVGLCWSLSEEAEELADFARDALPATREIVTLLTRHKNPATRWQAYDVLGDLTDDAAAAALREGLRDPDPYVRRRAFLAYGRHPPRITLDLIEAMRNDEDPYIRRAAQELAQRSGDPSIA